MSLAQCLGQRKPDKDAKVKHCESCNCASLHSSDDEKNVPDQVIPYNFLDDDPEFKNSVAFMSFRINAVLDEDKLRSALDEVFEMDGWRKLGARVRLNRDGKLEHHLPAQFSSERPPFQWSVDKQAIKIEDHPVISKMPDGTKHNIPTMYKGVEEWKEICYPSKTCPTTLEEYLTQDIPSVNIHIIYFQNATLLTLGWTHVVMDAVAATHLLRTWTLVLADRRGEITPFMEEQGDIVRKVAESKKTPSSKFLLIEKRLTGFQLLRFISTLLSETFWYPAQDWRTVCLPAAFVAQMKAQATAECGEYLSEGDVLGAWRNKIIAKAMQWPLSKPILMVQYYSLHGVLDELPKGRAFIGNWVCKMFVMTKTQDVLENSIGKEALHIRRQLKEQRTKEQAEAYVSMKSEEPLMFFGQPNMAFMGMSNVSGAKPYDLDFSPAAVDGGSGTIAYLHCDFYVKALFKVRNVGPIFGRDKHGDWWMSWVMRSEAWGRVEQELAMDEGIRLV